MCSLYEGKQFMSSSLIRQSRYICQAPLLRSGLSTAGWQGDLRVHMRQKRLQDLAPACHIFAEKSVATMVKYMHTAKQLRRWSGRTVWRTVLPVTAGAFHFLHSLTCSLCLSWIAVKKVTCQYGAIWQSELLDIQGPAAQFAADHPYSFVPSGLCGYCLLVSRFLSQAAVRTDIC